MSSSTTGHTSHQPYGIDGRRTHADDHNDDTWVASSPGFRNGVTSKVSQALPFDEVYTFVMMDAFSDGLDGGVYRITGVFPGEEPVLLVDSKFENGFFQTTTIDATTTLATSQGPHTTALPPPSTTASSTTAAGTVGDDAIDRTSAFVGTGDESGVVFRLGWIDAQRDRGCILGEQTL
eukprot:scaffold15478_cov123-Amphora_coffeaeformis.AAC.1